MNGHNRQRERNTPGLCGRLPDRDRDLADGRRADGRTAAPITPVTVSRYARSSAATNVSHSASLRLTGRTIGIVEDVRALTGHAISTLKADLHGVKSMAKPKRGRSTAGIDDHVGSRIRERRIMLGLTQQQLAGMIGVTYQQAHKYERGINRVSAGRLFEIARALSAPITYFYEGVGEFLRRCRRRRATADHATSTDAA